MFSASGALRSNVIQALRDNAIQETSIWLLYHCMCIYHMFCMQVAAHADHHLCVRKAVDPEGRVQTSVEALVDLEDRAHEIAAMLGTA